MPESAMTESAQIQADRYWMELALVEAQKAWELGEVPVGAVIVAENKLVATGHNRPIAEHDPTAHAEIMALRNAARLLGNYRLPQCSLYVTLEPCLMCAGAMMHARLARVVYAASDAKTGVAGSVFDAFALPFNHQTQVSGGVLAEPAALLLRDFFKQRRAAAKHARLQSCCDIPREVKHD